MSESPTIVCPPAPTTSLVTLPVPSARRRELDCPAREPRTRAGVQVKAVIVLAGAVRNELVAATRRSRLDLPLDETGTILNNWQSQIADWFDNGSQAPCQVRVMVQHGSHLPHSQCDGVELTVEQDPHDCRGTGGLLRDIANDYHTDDWLLVATGAQILLEPLAELVNRLSRLDGDVRLLAHADGTPVGLMLVRCACLRMLEPIGFVDFKEQGLPRIAQSHAVEFLMSNRPTGIPVATASDCINALRWHHLRRANPTLVHDPFVEDWQSTFALVEPGAAVEDTALLHDSIVLSGARVDRGATVVRSVVCPGAVVGRGQMVVDQLVQARSR